MKVFKVPIKLDDLGGDPSPSTNALYSISGLLKWAGVFVATISGTQTLTNKKITKRTGTVSSSATPTINTDNYDRYSITAQTVNITSFTTNLSGTPADGDLLWISIVATGTISITWGSGFENSGSVNLPAATVGTAPLDVGLRWNSVTSKWRCVAVA